MRGQTSDGWMNEWTGGWTDEWTDKWTDTLTDRNKLTSRQMNREDRQVNRLKDVQMQGSSTEKWTVRLTDRRAKRYTNWEKRLWWEWMERQTDARTDIRRMFGWMDRQMDGWMDRRMDGWMNTGWTKQFSLQARKFFFSPTSKVNKGLIFTADHVRAAIMKKPVNGSSNIGYC